MTIAKNPIKSLAAAPWTRRVTIPIVLTVFLAGCSTTGHPARHLAVTTTTTVPGISNGIILIGTHQPITGSDAVGQNEIAPSTAAFFAYVNSLGGIYGRKVVYKIEDDGSNPLQTGQVVRQMVLSDHIFALLDGSGTSDHASVEAFLNAEHVPDVFVGSGCTCWNNPGQYPWTSGWQPDFVVEGKILGQYLGEFIKAHPTLDKVGYIYEDNQMGKQEVEGLTQEIPSSQLVGSQVLNAPTTTTDQINQAVASLKSAGAQVVGLFGDPQLTAQVLDASYASRFLPEWAVPYSSSSPSLIGSLMATYAPGFEIPGTPFPSNFTTQVENSIFSDTFLPLASNTTNPWVALFKKIHDLYTPNIEFNSQVVYGMSLAYNFYQVLEAAGPHPTQAGLLRALDTTTLAGPDLTPLTYSSSSSQGMGGAQIVLDQNGVLVAQGPVYETTDHSGSISTYSGQPVNPPTNF